jgi:hypothetical protein
MLITEKTITNLIQTHFPFFYTEDNPLLVEFVKTYFSWMESEDQTLYHSRRLSEYKDIDSTVDRFLVYFKEKYLKNIQFNTAASTKRMVKHSLDLYRAKGTPRAIDLMFKVVFDTPAEVYLPSRDIFRLSSGDWYEQYYIEVSPAPINITFVGKQVEGVQSGCTAFVEKLVRKKVKGVYVEVFIISSIVPGKHFITGELIKTAGQIAIKNNPRIIGSLTNVQVLSGSQGFAVGDIVNINSDQGIGAKGRVTEIAEVTGKVDFDLIDGGFGYTTSANIYVSEKVLRLSNVQVNTQIVNNKYFGDFDTITEDQTRINVINSSSLFVTGETLYTYYSNGVVKGEGSIQRVIGNTASSNVYVTILTGNLVAGGASSVNAYYTASNAKSANIGPSGYTDLTETATVIGIADTIRINYANTLPFTNNETVYQLSNVGLISASGKVTDISASGLTGLLSVNDITGLFLPNYNIYGQTSGANGVVTSIGVDLGVVNVSGQFFSNSGNYIYCKDYQNNVYSNAVITTISTGSLASFLIANTLANPETIEIDTDFIKDYVNTALSAANYTPMNAPVGANLNSIIGDSLTYDAITIGTITALTGINSGQDYNIDPIVKIKEPLISQYNKKDLYIKISNSTGGFFVDEIIRQPNTGAKGLVKSANSSTVYIRSLSFENSFSNTAANTIVVGTGSGSQANVDLVFIDESTEPMGLNAVVNANVVSDDGSVTAIEVIDSGVGYRHLEVGSFASLDGERVGSASMFLGTRTANTEARGREGKSLGRYRTQDGFLSDDKKLQDSYYYQDFSYEIRSSVTLDKYEAMLKQLLHVAGTKYFAATVRSSIISVDTTVSSNSELINFTADKNTVNVDTTSITTDTNYI